MISSQSHPRYEKISGKYTKRYKLDANTRATIDQLSIGKGLNRGEPCVVKPLLAPLPARQASAATGATQSEGVDTLTHHSGSSLNRADCTSKANGNPDGSLESAVGR